MKHKKEQQKIIHLSLHYSKGLLILFLTIYIIINKSNGNKKN